MSCILSRENYQESVICNDVKTCIIGSCSFFDSWCNSPFMS